MFKLLAYTLSVFQFLNFSLAVPLNNQDQPGSESISQELFDTISLYQQYAAAAYCTQNFDESYKYTTLACPSGNCGQLQNGQTNITLQLSA